ncbi:hypothetical protein [Kineococcus aurantiacus]|uniref:Uncharacterized protein n=1 Tax=Kineococcus aurantiacus TaxID=37633 RepID=A0A7Y9ATJ4_9ACTN|nr:hypothetical protein [Kineococcus aurantiacus]NYD21708.1 hypothetical protein [Kineococcus aurantiacus]
MTHSLDPDPALDPDASPGRRVLPGARSAAPAAPLADTDLAEEIELYTDVVVAASESDGPLPEGELDRVLGVDGD